MKAILATDLSAASETAIKTETSLSCLAEIGVQEIHLVTVIPSNIHSGMPGLDLEGRRQRALQRYGDVMSEAGFDVETHVVRGTPQRRINGVASAVNADLTIIGSRGKSPLENRVIGSTARNLARTTVVPLLVNRVERATDEPDVVRTYLFRRILFATDFSENAQRAFEIFEYLHHSTEEVTLVHVETPKDPGPEDAKPVERLEGHADQLESMGLSTTTDIRSGDPADEILAAEAEHKPTTTLVGSRGQSQLRRLLLGSVSEEIVAKATGNVMLVPPPRKA
jgi:nucleotide-binding universal stress UspA family protein